MRTINLTKHLLAYSAAYAILASGALAQGVTAKTEGLEPGYSGPRVFGEPSRPNTPVQGKQKPEIHFDPATGVVTVKMLVQDSSGTFIPNIHPQNFSVYEDGVREQNATIEIEHAPVSVGMLLEYGGRYQELNRTLGSAVFEAAHEFLDEIGQDDKAAIWKYGDKVAEVSSFSQGREALGSALADPEEPPVSETNFYDALMDTVTRMKAVSGRKALLAISTGIDTFSKAKYADVLRTVRQAGVPIYAINIGPPVLEQASMFSSTSPYARLDWKRAAAELQEIAVASGGRMYSPPNTFGLSGIYDDLMENLRVRYVITYKSASDRDPGAARTVRIEVADSGTGGSAEIAGANGKPVHPSVAVEDSYVPRSAAVADLIAPPAKAHQ